MDSTSFSAVVDFEVYLLMTMKPRLSLSDTSGLLDSKLAMVGLSMDGAKRIRDRIAGALSVESSRFRDMKTLLGVGDEGAATFLKYSSVLWPGFEFRAQAGIDECLESAGYVHVQRTVLDVESPTQLPAWSADIAEFDKLFGPTVYRGGRPLFDDILPACDDYEFEWRGDRYGAVFLWGLFLLAARYWE